MTGRLPVLQQWRVFHPIPPNHPPTPLAPAPLSLARPGQLTWKVRWRLPAPSRWVMMRLPPSQSVTAPPSKQSPQKEIDIIHPHFFFFLICDLCLLSHGHCTHRLVVFRQVALGNMLDFPVCCCFIASKTSKDYHYYWLLLSALLHILQLQKMCQSHLHSRHFQVRLC